jgi:hypothetical protein
MYSILVGVIIHIIHIGFVIHNITELGWFPAGEFVCPPLLGVFFNTRSFFTIFYTLNWCTTDMLHGAANAVERNSLKDKVLL